MYIYDRYNFLMVVYVGHDRVIIARKPGSNFLPFRRSDCRILGGRGYILGGGVCWEYILGSIGFILGSHGWSWWVFFGSCRWWLVVGLLHLVVSGGRFIFGGSS